VDELGRGCIMYGEINAYKSLLGKLQGKRPLGRYRHK
jgi:hypothetical protein